MAPFSAGIWPSTGRAAAGHRHALGLAAKPCGLVQQRSARCPVVRASDRRVSSPVSSPSAMATTPASTSTPRPRRIHSPAPSELFHGGEDPPADQQRRRQRGRRAQRIGQQQQGGAGAGALDGGAGEDQAQDRPGAGRPQQPGGHAQQQRSADTALSRFLRLVGEARRPAPPAAASGGRPGTATAGSGRTGPAGPWRRCAPIGWHGRPSFRPGWPGWRRRRR